eukprot:6741806-Pyramimonas_sp.AAC.1
MIRDPGNVKCGRTRARQTARDGDGAVKQPRNSARVSDCFDVPRVTPDHSMRQSLVQGAMQ